MAETYDVAVAPHCPLGPIALAACLQIGISTPNHQIQEMSVGMHYNVEGKRPVPYTARETLLTSYFHAMQLVSTTSTATSQTQKLSLSRTVSWKPYKGQVWALRSTKSL